LISFVIFCHDAISPFSQLCASPSVPVGLLIGALALRRRVR